MRSKLVRNELFRLLQEPDGREQQVVEKRRRRFLRRQLPDDPLFAVQHHLVREVRVRQETNSAQQDRLPRVLERHRVPPLHSNFRNGQIHFRAPAGNVLLLDQVGLIKHISTCNYQGCLLQSKRTKKSIIIY